jgi:hypothetical protein
MPPAVEFTVQDDAGASWRPRFKPRKVPIEEIEAISGIAPPRHIRVRADLQAPVRVSVNLGAGVSRLHPGQEIILPARAAYAVVQSGCAEYLDEAMPAA